MRDVPQDDRRRSRASALLLGLSVLLGALACAVGGDGRPDGPRQGWWSGDGLVVPHDSFPADCSLCHIGDDWHTLRADFAFDHAAETGVELVGEHAAARCLLCHNDRGPVEVFAARGCAGCHEDVHRGLQGTGCADCHLEAAPTWGVRLEVEEHTDTRFPLVGAHAATPCWRCHPGAEIGNFARADVECLACHRDDLTRALEPNHVAQGWVDSCDRCHIPTTWEGAGFNHGGFPLTGAHARLDCEACHTGGGFTGVPSDCYSCHASDYTGARDPNHVALMFPTSCELCHGTSTWEGAIFDHSAVMNACVDCHLADYQQTTDPDHQAQGFPTSCELCHGTTTWEGGMFDHGGITTGCFECHADEYRATTRPNHSMAGFPTACELCHSTSTWTPADFNHSFPIDGGDHGRLDCAECHPSPRNFAQFTCTDCHAHTQRDMNDEHDRVRGYVYQTDACYACHPSGDR